VSRSAARSLQEGLEETLALHRLGLFEELEQKPRWPPTVLRASWETLKATLAR
jgi:hypothetical protein